MELLVTFSVSKAQEKFSSCHKHKYKIKSKELGTKLTWQCIIVLHIIVTINNTVFSIKKHVKQRALEVLTPIK